MDLLPTYQTLDAPLDFTAAAAAKVANLIAEEGNPALKLRVYISRARTIWPCSATA
jgi:iron-sulfur cluster insertion protein